MIAVKKWLKNKMRNALNIVAIEKEFENIFNAINCLEQKIDSLKTDIPTSNNLESSVINQNDFDDVKTFLTQLVDRSKSGSIFTCNINGINLLAPVELLRLYPHCLYPQEEQKLTYYVETAHSNWLCSKLKHGDVALDIGAAFGVISAGLSQSVGKQGHVYSFEPSQTAQKFLQKLLDLNNIQNVTVVKNAIADTVNTIEFIEYTSDNELIWASDTSTLASPNINPTMKHLRYQVDVTTIDEYVIAKNIQPKGIKIDIEGFELYALQGGQRTLETYLPYLCIDIHPDVKTGVSALEGVEPFLSKIGYVMEMEGHVLLCTPKK
jgi:FkbM family methyltransferase